MHYNEGDSGEVNEWQTEKFTIKSTKRLLINTLGKDIDTMDAILDLIDTSIDWYFNNNIDYKARIDVKFNADEVIIEDNCGGIPKEKVPDLFKFGESLHVRKGTIGTFGVGAKRAIFKLGEDIFLESDDGRYIFNIHIDKDWIDSETLELEMKYKPTTSKKLSRMVIKELYFNISDDLANPLFQSELFEKIRDTYTSYIEQDKFEIFVNNASVKHYDFQFFQKKGYLEPYHQKSSIGDKVEVEIYAGFTKQKNYDDPFPFGWFVFCNNRLVVRKDKTEKTGFNQEYTLIRNPKDIMFLGLIYFKSEDKYLLPWQTTKDDISEESRIYRQAKDTMERITNRFMDVLKLSERKFDEDKELYYVEFMFDEIPLVSKNKITENQNEKVPKITAEKGYDTISKIPTLTRVEFWEKSSLVQQVKKELQDPHMSNEKMGKKLFQYFIEMREVEDD